MKKNKITFPEQVFVTLTGVHAYLDATNYRY